MARGGPRCRAPGVWVSTVCFALTVVVVTGAAVVGVRDESEVVVARTRCRRRGRLPADGVTGPGEPDRMEGVPGCRKGEPDDGGDRRGVAEATRPGDPDPRAGRHGRRRGSGGRHRRSGPVPCRGWPATDAHSGSPGVPLLHGVFRATLGSPAARSAARAAAILAPITLGTVTPGAVVDVVAAVVEVVEVGATVVVGHDGAGGLLLLRGRRAATGREDAAARGHHGARRDGPDPGMTWIHHGSCAVVRSRRRCASRRTVPPWPGATSRC